MENMEDIEKGWDVMAGAEEYDASELERKVQVGDYLINYTSAGHGPNYMICMYGNLGTYHDYEYQLKDIDQEKFTVIVWDAPGYGHSRPPEIDQVDHSYADKADHLYQFLQVMKIEKCDVLGWCSGGTIAIFLAAKYPQVVKKLVIWGTYPYVSDVQKGFTEMKVDIAQWSAAARDPKVEFYGMDYLQKLAATWMNNIRRLHAAGDVCMSQLPKIQCPVLILHGEKEFYLDMAQVEYLRDNIPNARFEIYPGGKHNIHQKFAEKFNRQVEKFFLGPDEHA